ncbi:MAG TPA: hypothetical protein VM871_06190 [Flavisolibacter sp.]|nr:hypothetical protein [Flavisolibacter sp.]
MNKWVVAYLLLPFVCASQGVKLNQYDKFIKKHRVEMDGVSLLSSPANSLTITFSAVASEVFVQVSGWGWGATTVDDGNELVFLFSNDSSLSVTAVGLQTFEMGLEKNSYKHLYRISQAGMQALARQELVGIRKYSFKEFSETKVSKESKTRLQKSVALFLNELKKSSFGTTLKQIGANNVAGYIGDSVRFCSSVYNTSYNESAGERLTVLELQSDFSHPVVNVVISAADRLNFGDVPEKFYLNKDVCISGTVTLHNNIPTIVVRNSGQISVAGNGITSPTPPSTTGTTPGNSKQVSKN